jgi:hypothetical protein
MHDETEIPSSTGTGLSDGVKLGILAGTLGLTGLVAWAYRDGGWLAKKTAKGGGPGYGPTLPVGGAAWSHYQYEQNPPGYGPTAWGAPGYAADHQAKGGLNVSAPVGSEQWAAYQAQQNPPGYGPTGWGAPGYEADHRAQGGGRTYICGGGESANVIATKYGRTAAELVASNPGIDWTQPCGQNTQVAIPDAWPLMS